MPPFCRLQRLYRTCRSSLRPAPCQPSAVHLSPSATRKPPQCFHLYATIMSPSATLSHTPLLIETHPTPAFCRSFIAFSDSEHRSQHFHLDATIPSPSATLSCTPLLIAHLQRLGV